MPLWLAVFLLAADVLALVLASRRLRGRRTLQTVCVVLCALLALICLIYIGLTLLFVGAASAKPPAELSAYRFISAGSV